jgi:hypothetical protein
MSYFFLKISSKLYFYYKNIKIYLTSKIIIIIDLILICRFCLKPDSPADSPIFLQIKKYIQKVVPRNNKNK